MSVSAAYDPNNPISVTISGGVGPRGADGAAGAVFSVNGKTGTVVLTAVDLTAASATHTHDASAVQAGTLSAARLPLATTTAVGAVSVTSGLSVTAGGALSANVRSVAGRTGDITLAGGDVSGVVTALNGLSGALAIAAGSNITVASGGTTVAITSIASGNVASVNGRVGTVVLTAVDLTAASATHTHDASAIQAGTLSAARLPLATTTAVGAVSVTSGLSVTAGGALSANVRSVAGRTGDIALTGSDVSGVVATLNGLSGSLAISAGSNITVAAGGTTVTISSTASGGAAGVSSIAGLTGTVTITAFGLSTSTSGSALTLDARPVRTTPAAISASQNDYNPGAGDIFRISSSSTNALNITGLSTAAMSRESLLINVSTHTSSTLTFKHQNTNSTAAARIISPWAGDVVLAPNGGAAVVVYDDTDSRWRVI